MALYQTDIIITRSRSVNWRRGIPFLTPKFCIALYFTPLSSFYDSQSAFRAALSDSFNTPDALNSLRDLISKTNVYINSRGTQLNIDLVENIARWVGDMLRMFGLGEGEKTELGWGQIVQGSENINVSSLFALHVQLLTRNTSAGRNIDAISENFVFFPGWSPPASYCQR